MSCWYLLARFHPSWQDEQDDSSASNVSAHSSKMAATSAIQIFQFCAPCWDLNTKARLCQNEAQKIECIEVTDMKKR